MQGTSMKSVLFFVAGFSMACQKAAVGVPGDHSSELGANDTVHIPVVVRERFDRVFFHFTDESFTVWPDQMKVRVQRKKFNHIDLKYIMIVHPECLVTEYWLPVGTRFCISVPYSILREQTSDTIDLSVDILSRCDEL